MRSVPKIMNRLWLFTFSNEKKKGSFLNFIHVRDVFTHGFKNNTIISSI